MKTLKQEEIHCSEYRDIDGLRADLSRFFDTYYNPTRLHSALGYQSRPTTSKAKQQYRQLAAFQPHRR